jgi:hypothetical protein
MQAILFGLGTLLSPPLPASAPFASPLGLRFRLFLPLFPVGRDKSLKYPSGGVFELEDILLAGRRHVGSYSNSHRDSRLDRQRRRAKEVSRCRTGIVRSTLVFDYAALS